ncbi:MAG: GNAT family N-acetyltransferase [Candidatus Eisenbacteria bacterium]|uniref:GNAT family N-acetyltransferase n=1 Tax=Eiseniibacteriota bacterium TaxID=2212470 RepID=A0A849SLZ1_UNCEI|nr:GNAT family N-acetyltransferase [Candidatus Eisenbacteria bacterium]
MSPTPAVAPLPALEPAILDGQRVRMEPLDLTRHFDGLVAIGLDDELWRWTLNHPRTPDELRGYLETALREQAEHRSIPFATIDKASGRVAGCTRFGNIDRANRRVEIGWTWVGRPYQRSHVNTEAKHLMFRHAFEVWGCARVELKTNVLNDKSRNAMKRIGCVEEGVLRKHAVSDAGVWRDSIFYSVIDTEWPAVKRRLEEMMTR